MNESIAQITDIDQEPTIRQQFRDIAMKHFDFNQRVARTLGMKIVKPENSRHTQGGILLVR
jgi:hypothetical protein